MGNQLGKVWLFAEKRDTIAKIYVFILVFQSLELLGDCVRNFARKEEVGQETYLGDALIS